MKAHLAKLSLALLSAVFLLGCQEQGSSPVGPEGLGPEFNKPDVNGNHNHGDDGDPEQATLTLADGMQPATAFPVEVSKDTRKTLKVTNHDFAKPTITMNFTELASDPCVGVVGTNGGTVPVRDDGTFKKLLEQLTATPDDAKVVMQIDKTALGSASDRHTVSVQYESPDRDLGLIRISLGSVFDDVDPAAVTWTQTDDGPDVFLFTGPVVVWDAGGGIKDQSVIQCPGQTVVVTLNR